jgi:curved DNA-binding protein CbpA
MPLPQNLLDPEGYYARLGVHPSAPATEIAAAFRRKARTLHPDIPVTGNATAFVAARQAHDILINPGRRAAYDRSARRAMLDTMEVGEIAPDAPLRVSPVPTRHPRISDLPIGLWVTAGIVICFGVLEAVLHFSGVVGQTAQPERPAPSIAAASHSSSLATASTNGQHDHAGGNAASAPAAAPQLMRLSGTPNYYVVPAAGPTILWRVDPQKKAFVPVAQLPPFSSVQGLRLFQQTGLMEVQVTDSTTGLVEASRLSPGDPASARRAYCTYNAGASPNNGEVLERRKQGNEAVQMSNRSAQPAVVKLRDSTGTAVVSVFLAPGGSVEVGGLPLDSYQPDFAIGEMWSRACNTFAAGMRAQRFRDLTPLRSLNPLQIPPDSPDDSHVEDIPDRTFEGE